MTRRIGPTLSVGAVARIQPSSGVRSVFPCSIDGTGRDPEVEATFRQAPGDALAELVDSSQPSVVADLAREALVERVLDGHSRAGGGNDRVERALRRWFQILRIHRRHGAYLPRLTDLGITGSDYVSLVLLGRRDHDRKPRCCRMFAAGARGQVVCLFSPCGMSGAGRDRTFDRGIMSPRATLTRRPQC
jgi:hypothetical protein